MGKTKQLLPFKDSTLLEHTIVQAQSSKANKVYCVLGANSEVIKNKIKTSAIAYIDNPNWYQGLSSSIVTGINHILRSWETPNAVLILLSDQPNVDSNYIDLLLETYTKNPGSIVTSNYGNKKGVPAIFPKESFELLLNLKGDKGAKQLLNSNTLKTVSVVPNTEHTLRDIDTPKDYNSLLNN